MFPELTEEEVRAKAEARGFALIPTQGGYSLTRPPDTTPLTDTVLSLQGIQQWLEQH